MEDSVISSDVLDMNGVWLLKSTSFSKGKVSRECVWDKCNKVRGFKGRKIMFLD